jgi:hypothetical protein
MKFPSRLVFSFSLCLAVTSAAGAQGEAPQWHSAIPKDPVQTSEPEFKGDRSVECDHSANSSFFNRMYDGLRQKKEAILTADYSKETDRKITKLAIFADCKMLCGSPYLFYRINFPDYEDSDSSFPELGGFGADMPWVVPGQIKKPATEEDSQLPMPRRVPEEKPQPMDPGGVSIYQPVRESNR